MIHPGTQSMIENLKKNTGKDLEEWFGVLATAGQMSHTEMMTLLKSEPYSLRHGFANSIALNYRARDLPGDDQSMVDAQFAGAKQALRPLFDTIIEHVSAFGADVEVAPKKASVSLRRSKQFALVEAPSAKRLQLGINLSGVTPTDRLLSATGMCTHKVNVEDAAALDDELWGWLKAAYDRA